MTSRPRTGALALALALLLSFGARAVAQPAEIPNAAQLALSLAKLKVMGSALYVAAHPDDENTALLAYWSRGRLVETAYLSMTRGDGGQNLIGAEKGELIGVLRTQELLAARRIDGAKQLFTRAIDFGYTKSAEETLELWGKEPVLADTVFAIRKHRPDVIVTRFPTTGEGGHGQHTASSILAEEAFKAAGDPSRFPEQLKHVQPWQPKRLLWNVFRFGPDAKREPKPGWVGVDLGAYNALLGKAYTEIAAVSRSMHKSQGFGSAERRGTWLNDFEPRLGEPAKDDLFDGVDLTWGRVKGGEAVARVLDEATRAFDPKSPSAVVPLLVRAYTEMGKLAPDPLVEEKKKQTLELIRECAGLWLEAIAALPSASAGEDVKVTAAALNRSPLAIELETVESTPSASAVSALGAASTPGSSAPTPAAGPPATVAGTLANNVPKRAELVVAIPKDAPVSNPYWLVEPPVKGLFTVRDQALIGLPESPAPLAVRFALRVAGERLVYETPVFFRETDPVKGEQYRRFEIVPAVTASLDEKQYLFAGDGERKPANRALTVTLRAERPSVEGTLRLRLPQGWTSAPESAPFALGKRGSELPVRFTITPPAAAGTGAIEAVAEVSGERISRGVVTIDYPHVPVQVLFPSAEAKLVRVHVKTRKKEIGYVTGSGDEVPDGLRQLGYRVTLLDDEDLATADLSRFESIVAGIRAYNTRPRLKQLHGRLMDYVKNGGTYVVQYITTSDLVTDEIGPFPFKLSRDRVTREDAKVAFLSPEHPLLTSPNRITEADFDGWVQERGLYFASEAAKDRWDARYETPIATHDPGETDKPGGLLYAKHGKGVFVYTGYAFFRQLPAGVPGAIRLFANLVSASGEPAPRAAARQKR
jgi:LmbE family N-acetylglucosaminyl deacetylase